MGALRRGIDHRQILAVALFFTTGCWNSVSFSVSTDAGKQVAAASHQDGGSVGDSAIEGASPSDATSPSTDSGTVISVSGDLSFGAIDCGTAADAQTITLTNASGGPVTFTALLGRASSSPYALSYAPTDQVIGAHGTATIRVTPSAIPTSSPTPGTYDDVVTITTDAQGDRAHVVQLSESAQGAILSFDTQGIPFGDVPVGTSQSSTFHVVNSGTATGEVRLSVGAASSASFTVDPSGTHAVSSGVNLTANATFSPTGAGGDTGSIALEIDPSTALCAPLPAPLVVTGMGENGGLTVSASSLPFGETSCGTTAAAQTFTLTNSGNSPLTWSLQLSNTSPSPYTVNPTTGSLAPGVKSTVTVTPGPIPAQSSVQKGFYADMITINTDVVGDEPHVIAVNQTAKGAILAFGATSLGFGDVPVGTTGLAPFQVINSGNQAASVTLASGGTAFAASPAMGTGATSVGADATSNFNGSFSPGSSTATQTGTFTLSTGNSTVLCAPLPAPLPLSGTGTNGVVAFSPSALSFGNQTAAGLTACGTQASPQTVTFTNTGSIPYVITASLGEGSSSPYTFTMTPTTGSVAANGGTASLVVAPAAVPASSAVPGAYDDVLTVTTTASGDSPHPINLTQSAYGAILSAPPSTITFPATTVGGQSSSQVGITNSGNAPAIMSWSAISNGVFTFDENVALPPGGVTTNSNAYFAPTAATPYSATATLSVASSTVLCAPLASPNVSLSATGISSSSIVVTPNPVDFNMVACGTAGGTRTVTIKNNSMAGITWNAALTTGSNFTITPATGTVASGATGTLTVTSKAVPVSTSTTTASNGFGDTLTITTNAPNDTAHAVPILETASGAILAWSSTMLNLPASQRGQPIPFAVQNTGNVQATVSVTLANPSAAILTLNPPASGTTANGSPFQDSVTEAPLSTPSTTATLTVAAPGTVLCQPLPAALPITAN